MGRLKLSTACQNASIRWDVVLNTSNNMSHRTVWKHFLVIAAAYQIRNQKQRKRSEGQFPKVSLANVTIAPFSLKTYLQINLKSQSVKLYGRLLIKTIMMMILFLGAGRNSMLKTMPEWEWCSLIQTRLRTSLKIMNKEKAKRLKALVIS